MAVLPTYSAQVAPSGIAGGRRASAEDFSSPIGDVAGTVRTAANAFLADAEDSEARKALVASSEIRAKYARELDQAATSGADLEKLKEQMTNDLAKVGEGFQTRRGSEAIQMYTANTSLMFDEQANSIEVRRAAATARLEGSKFINSASAIIQSNPLYLGTAEKDAEALVSTFSRISPEQKALLANELKQDLNMAAAISAARIDPEGTKRKLDAGEWNLSAEQRQAAVNKAETEMRAKRADEAYQRAEQKRALHKADDKARDTHFAAIVGGKASRRSIMDDPDLLPATREHLINVMEVRARRGAGEEKRSDPRTVRDLWMRIHAPDGSPNKIFNGNAIFEAVASGRVNVTDANQLNALVANQKDENNRSIGSKLGAQMAIIGRALSQDPQFTAQPALVAEIQNNYQARVFDRVSTLRKENKDPSEIFDPSSKLYVGSREFIQGSIDEARGAKVQSAAPTVRTQAEYDALPPGTPYVDANGVAGIKKGKAAPAENDTAQWMAATGGKLKPGQTQAQAVEAWKKGQ